jgi:hypothetical protein
LIFSYVVDVATTFFFLDVDEDDVERVEEGVGVQGVPEDEDEDKVDGKSLFINEWYFFGKLLGSNALESDKFMPNTINVF